ncbi:hypothetical protein LguiA_023394 [Lonicera macranthoides]
MDALLEEPLLNGNDGENNVRDSNKSNLGENLALFSSASISSILTFSWMNPLIATGYKKALDLEDVPQLASVDTVKWSFPILRNKIESDSGSNGQVTAFTLVKALVCTTWKEILSTGLLSLTYSVASYIGPYLIDTFVQYLNGHREFKNEGYLLVYIFFLAKLVECMAQRHWYFRLQQAGARAKAALVAMIYNIGLTSVAAFAATVIVMLANFPLGSLQEKFQDKLMKSKDRRMKATSEVLRNMRILKLQGWEMKFLSRIIELRNIEAGWLRKYPYTWAMTMFFFWGAPTFVSVVTFGACMLMGISLE